MKKILFIACCLAGFSQAQLEDIRKEVLSLLSVKDHTTLEAIRERLESGGDLFVRNAEGQTLLHLAARAGDKDLAALLLEKGADVNAVDRYGETPFLVALRKGHPETAELLLGKEGVNVNAQDSIGDTALIHAINKKYFSLAEKIIGMERADVNRTNRYGDTAVYLASKRGYLNIVKALSRRGDTDLNVQRGLTKMTPLMAALEREHVKVADHLLEKGVDVTVKDFLGFNAHYYAVRAQGRYSPLAEWIDVLEREVYHSGCQKGLTRLSL